MKRERQFIKSRRGIVGLEAAIVLIAFVIVAAAFSFMVVNQGLFATQRGRVVIQEGLKQASTPLTIDGSVIVRTTKDGNAVDIIIIPVKAFGVKYVAMWKNGTVITMKLGRDAYANIYGGVLYEGGYNSSAECHNTTDITYDPSDMKFDDFVGIRPANQTATTPVERRDAYVNGTYSDRPLITAAVLCIENSNGDEALDTFEKGYLIIVLSGEDAVSSRALINIEIRLEKTATLSMEFSIPESMPMNTYVICQ